MGQYLVEDTDVILKEAEKVAVQLKIKLLDDKHPFQSAIKAISSHDTLSISSAGEAAKWADTALSHALTLAKGIHPVVASPTLLQAATDFYFVPHHDNLQGQLPWLGTVLKSSFAFVWSNLYAEAEAREIKVNDILNKSCHFVKDEHLMRKIVCRLQI